MGAAFEASSPVLPGKLPKRFGGEASLGPEGNLQQPPEPMVQGPFEGVSKLGDPARQEPEEPQGGHWVVLSLEPPLMGLRLFAQDRKPIVRSATEVGWFEGRACITEACVKRPGIQNQTSSTNQATLQGST